MKAFDSKIILIPVGITILSLIIELLTQYFSFFSERVSKGFFWFGVSFFGFLLLLEVIAIVNNFTQQHFLTPRKKLEQYKEKGLWCIESKEIRKQFIDDVKKDIETLKEIHKKWFSKGFPHDPKIVHFKEHIELKLKENPKRKIIVFTEFSDTANYISRSLKDDFKLFKYSAKDSSEKNKELIRENFDAANKYQKNDYDILIATDAISEGFNLHRAGIVFNYDILGRI